MIIVMKTTHNNKDHIIMVIVITIRPNTSFWPRQSQNTVNYGSFWHFRKAQVCDLCVIAYHTNAAKPSNLKPYSLSSKNVKKTLENQGNPLNTKHLNP
jgi:hypothetical protein